MLTSYNNLYWEFLQYFFGSDVWKYMYINQSFIIVICWSWSIVRFNFFLYNFVFIQTISKFFPTIFCIILWLFKILSCRLTFSCKPWFLVSLEIFIIQVQFLFTKNFFSTLYKYIYITSFFYNIIKIIQRYIFSCATLNSFFKLLMRFVLLATLW